MVIENDHEGLKQSERDNTVVNKCHICESETLEVQLVQHESLLLDIVFPRIELLLLQITGKKKFE